MQQNDPKDKHVQLKAKCLKCNLHFLICTEHPETYSKETLFCPECGQHEGNFVTWSEVGPGPIYREVPGDAPLTDDIALTGPNTLKTKQITDTH